MAGILWDNGRTGEVDRIAVDVDDQDTLRDVLCDALQGKWSGFGAAGDRITILTSGADAPEEGKTGD